MESSCYLVVVRMMGGERGRIAEEILPRRVHVLVSHHFIARFLRRPSELSVARITPSASMVSWELASAETLKSFYGGDDELLGFKSTKHI